MKCPRKFSRWLLVACLLGSLAVPAQTPGTPAAASSSPSAAPALWDFQQEIGLTDAQVSKIKTTVNTLQQRIATDVDKQRQLETEVTTMFQQDADMAAIRSKLQAAADLYVDMRMSDLQAARTIKSTMTKDQEKKWEAILARLKTQPQSGSPLPPPNQ